MSRRAVAADRPPSKLGHGIFLSGFIPTSISSGRVPEFPDVLYHFHEYHRALFSPAMQWAEAAARMFSSPGSWLTQLPGASGVAAGYELVLPARQAVRKAEASASRHGGRRAARACAVRRGDGAGAAVLPPAALQALQRRRRHRRAAEGRSAGAGGRAAVRPPRHAAARHRAHAAARPQGLHHRLDRRAHGAARRRRVHARRLRRLHRGVHPPHRRRAACT